MVHKDGRRELVLFKPGTRCQPKRCGGDFGSADVTMGVYHFAWSCCTIPLYDPGTEILPPIQIMFVNPLYGKNHFPCRHVLFEIMYHSYQYSKRPGDV
jgi:hypothetical protein